MAGSVEGQRRLYLVVEKRSLLIEHGAFAQRAGALALLHHLRFEIGVAILAAQKKKPPEGG